MTTPARFSSQMLALFGIQPRVISTGTGTATQYRYNGTGSVSEYAFLPSDGTVRVSGGISPNDYNQSRCFYEGRGITGNSADTLATIAVDAAQLLGVTTGYFLENSYLGQRTRYSSAQAETVNLLRDQTNQIANLSSINNRISLQSRQIRA